MSGSNDGDESDDRIEKIIQDERRRADQFADLLIQGGQTGDLKTVMAHFLGVSLKLRDTEMKLHLAELKERLIDSNLETARQLIQCLHEIATEAPHSQLRDDLTYFIGESKRRAAAQGVQL